MKNVVLLILLAAILLSACSAKKVEEMERREDGTCWVTISDIGTRRVKFDDYVLCSVGYYRVRCWR